MGEYQHERSFRVTIKADEEISAEQVKEALDFELGADMGLVAVEVSDDA